MPASCAPQGGRPRLSGADFGAPHELVANGREEVLPSHADKVDGERCPAHVDGNGATESGATRVEPKREGVGVG